MAKSLTYESDEVLLETLRKGEPAAFEFLYRQYFRMVAKQANESGLPAEDLFQEVLLILVRKIQQPDFQLSAKLSTFLFAIARNLALKAKGQRTNVALDESVLTRLGEAMPDNESEVLENKLKAVADVLGQIEGDCRTLLLLSFFEKRSQAEIAEMMGYAEAFVKVKKHRCLGYLRKRLQTHPFFRDS